MAARHFLTLNDLSSDELESLVDHGTKLRNDWRQGVVRETLKNRVLAMIFEKSSTRTRVSFEAGMTQLGGAALFLSPRDTQLGRGEPIEDSAIVISSMVDAVMIRTFSHDTVDAFAAASRVPVINALTDDFHPCQLLADMQTYREHRGSIRGGTVAWVGDGNNMCQSYINAATQFGFNLRVACPEGYEPDSELLKTHQDRVSVVHDPAEAARELPDQSLADEDGGQGRPLHALPAGAPWRGDIRGHDGTPAFGGLGRSRKPLARPESAAGIPDPQSTGLTE